MSASSQSTREFKVGEEFEFYTGSGYQGKVVTINDQGIHLVDVTTTKGRPLGKYGYTIAELRSVTMPLSVAVKKDHECVGVDVGFRFTKIVCKICNKEI